MTHTVVAVVDLAAGDSRAAAARFRRLPGVSRVLLTSPGGRIDGTVSPTAVIGPALDAGADALWFLTADAVPEPDALPRLLDALASGTSVGISGPRLTVDGTDRLAAASATVTASGHRLAAVSQGQTDQGQFARREDVYAVDSVGMLVSAEAAEACGAPSPSLPHAYRGIEYCRRVRGAGFRVVLASSAAVSVSEELASEFVSSPRPPRSAADLRGEQRFRLAGAPRTRSGLTAAGLLIAALGAALLALLSNDVRTAGRRIRAALGLGSDLRATSGLRALAPRREPAPTLLGSRRALEIARRDLRERGMRRPGRRPAHEEADLLDDEAPTDESANTADELSTFSRLDTGSTRSVLRHPLAGVLLAAVLGAAALGYRMLGPGVLTGGALPRLDVGARASFARALSSYLPGGLGDQAPADPLLTVLAVLSLPFGGSLDLAVRIILLTALPIAALVMYAAAGAWTRRPGARAVAALVWTASPAFLLSAASGRIGVVFAWLAAPLCMRALRAALRGSAEASAAAGLLAAVAIAGVPALTVPWALLVLAALVLVRRIRLVWLALPPIGLLGAWLTSAAMRPGALLADVGTAVETSQPQIWQLVLGWPEEPHSALLGGQAAVIWTVVLLALSAVVPIAAGWAHITRRVRSGILLPASALIGAGVVLAVVQTLMPVGITPESMVAAWPGAGLLIAGLGAVGLIVAVLDPETGARTRADAVAVADEAEASDADDAVPKRRRLRGVTPPVGALVSAAAVAVLALVAVDAAVGGATVHRTRDAALPVFAAERASGPDAQRTLIVDVGDGADGARAQIADAATGTVLASSTLAAADDLRGLPPQRRPAPLDAADADTAVAVARLTAGDGADARDSLRRLGVGFVVLSGSGEALEDASRTISVSPGLTRLGDSDRGRLWQVEAADPIAWAHLVEPDGTASPLRLSGDVVTVPEGADGRILVVASRAGTVAADDASAGARALPEADSGDWRQAFAVSADAADIRLSRSPWWYGPAVLAGWGLVLLSVVVAVPIGVRRRR